MRAKGAPRVARWILEHAVPSQSWSESLEGDLAEQMGRRSAGWYWRQVAGVMATGWAREIHRLRLAIVFALLYVFPEPLLWLRVLYARGGGYMRLFGWGVALPWPWSLAVQVCMNLGVEILFIWSGYAVYLVLAGVVSRPLRRGPAIRGMVTAVWVFVVAEAAVLVVQFYATFAPINVRTASDATVVLAPRMMLSAIPAVVAMVCAIRRAIPVEGGNGSRVASV